MKTAGVIAIATALLTACVPTATTKPTKVGDRLVSPVEATWLRAVTFVPALTGEETDSPVVGMMFHDEVQAALARLEARGRALPVIVYLHGCMGQQTDVWTLGERYARQGYILIAPNSFVRPGRRETCGRSAWPGRGTVLLRDQELRHARAQIEQRPWARQSHVYLMGWSEGGTRHRVDDECRVSSAYRPGVRMRHRERRARARTAHAAGARADRGPRPEYSIPQESRAEVRRQRPSAQPLALHPQHAARSDDRLEGAASHRPVPARDRGLIARPVVWPPTKPLGVAANMFSPATAAALCEPAGTIVP